MVIPASQLSYRHCRPMQRAGSCRVGAPGAALERCTDLSIADCTLKQSSSGRHSGDFAALRSSPSQPSTVRVLSTSAIARATNKSVEEISERKQQLRVAYQGLPGAYSEGAAQAACPEHEPLPCEQFETAFQALSQWMADRACLPVENSLGGSIHTVYDLLLRYNVHIVGEKSVPINHCLLACSGVKQADLTRVISHPQALAQCDEYLRDMDVVKEAVDDTAESAGAAHLISTQQLPSVGAIASRRAAELYGLDILDEGVQDVKCNVTRFIVLSRDPLVTTRDVQPGSESMKTSIVFSLATGPGNLFKALSCFALRDIDMTKIESRPLRTNPMSVSKDGESNRLNYLFYVDVLGAMADPNVQKALGHLQEVAPFLRVLGSYPADLAFLRT